MRYDLTDHEWTVIRPMLPNEPRGVLRVDDRRVLNGIFWVFRRRNKIVRPTQYR
jgi:transposase